MSSRSVGDLPPRWSSCETRAAIWPSKKATLTRTVPCAADAAMSLASASRWRGTLSQRRAARPARREERRARMRGDGSAEGGLDAVGLPDQGDEAARAEAALRVPELARAVGGGERDLEDERDLKPVDADAKVDEAGAGEDAEGPGEGGHAEVSRCGSARRRGQVRRHARPVAAVDAAVLLEDAAEVCARAVRSGEVLDNELDACREGAPISFQWDEGRRDGGWEACTYSGAGPRWPPRAADGTGCRGAAQSGGPS